MKKFNFWPWIFLSLTGILIYQLLKMPESGGKYFLLWILGIGFILYLHNLIKPIYYKVEESVVIYNDTDCSFSHIYINDIEYEQLKKYKWSYMPAFWFDHIVNGKFYKKGSI